MIQLDLTPEQRQNALAALQWASDILDGKADEVVREIAESRYPESDHQEAHEQADFYRDMAEAAGLVAQQIEEQPDGS